MKGITPPRARFGRGIVCRLTMISVLTMLPLLVSIAQERQPEYDTQGNLDRLEAAHRASEDSLNRASGEDVDGREEWFRFQRRYPYDMIPAGARAAAIRTIKTETERLAISHTGKDDASLLAISHWEQIGPFNWSGRTRAIAISPVDPKTMFIGVASGGVWKTVDGGSTWTTTFDNESAISVCAVAIDPANTNNIYVGTGENTQNIDAYLGDGVFKSTDGGATWANVGLTNVGAVSKIWANHDTVYAAAAKSNGGFYRSFDGGVTWERTFSQATTIFDMSVNPRNHQEIFLGSNTSIYRSNDGGKTFASITSGMTLTSALRLSVAVAPSDTNRVYALVARSGGSGLSNIGEAYLSTNGGDAWTKVKTFDASFFSDQGWYDNCIAVEPTNAKTVMVGGIDIYRSLDGGTTWNNCTFVYQGGSVHPDQHVIVVSPSASTPDLVYIGNDGGVFSTSNAGTNWQRTSNVVPTSQYYAMDVDQTRRFRVYGGTQDNGTHGSFDDTKYAQSWNRVLSGDGFFVTVDLTNPNFIYAENFNGSPLYRINATSASTLNQMAQIDASADISADAGYWSTPLAMSPADRQSLYSGRSFLWKNANPRTSTTWQKLVPDSSFSRNGKKISAIGLSPLTAAKMIVGTATGEVRFSTDAGVSWKATTGTPTRFVTQLRYDPVDPDVVYATFSGFGGGHVYKSTNSGASFVSISNNLPDLPCNAIEIDSTNPTHLFVASDAGVFMSLQGGAYWMPFNDGLPLVPVADLRIHKSSRSLVAATHGRSMFRVDISAPTAQPVLLYPTGGQTFTTPGHITIRWIGFTGAVRVLVSYDGGVTFDTIAASISADSVGLDFPLIRTTKAIVRVEQIGDTVNVVSKPFTIAPVANISELGKKGFVAEALAVMGDDLWATSRGSDTIYKLRLPLLVTKTAVVRSGISGTVRDLDYDQRRSLFYALVANADGSSAKVYRMDATAAATGQVTLPTTTVTAIAVLPSTPLASLALFSPESGGKIYIVNPDDGSVVQSYSPLQGAVGGVRHGLVWNGNGYIQGVEGRDPNASFSTEVQRIKVTDQIAIAEVVPVITNSGTLPVFFGLTVNPTASDPGSRLYYATDTAGAIYSFKASLFSTDGVSSVPMPADAGRAAIAGVMPNPLRSSGTLHFLLSAKRMVNIDLYTPAGDRIAHVADGLFEPGEQRVAISAEGIPSGVYYVTMTTDAGDRAVQPVVIVR